MKFKKTIAIALSVAALLTMTACGSTGEPAATTAAGTTAAETAAAAEQTTEAPKSVSGTVSLAGSTSMQKLCEAMIESFSEEYPDITVTAEYTGSGAGLEAVAAGKTDIGNASRALKDSEKAAGVEENIVAIDGIAVIANKAGKVLDLTTGQLSDIYTGKITNWKDLGGDDEAIVVIGREAGSGTRGAFEELVGVEDACKYLNEYSSTGDVIGNVASNPSAIGYASLSAVGDNVKAVKVNGVECSEATVQDGTYEIQRPFVMITKDGTQLSDAAQAFLDFAMSADAASLIAQAGAVPPAK